MDLASTLSRLAGRYAPGLILAACLAVSARAETIRDCPECPPMVAIAAGATQIGQDGRRKEERPAITVRIDRPFAIAKTETTFAQWQACVAAGGCRAIDRDMGWGKGDRPIIHVTYDDAVAYVAWLRQLTARPYRLPTEVEWEHAARAGTATRYWWGERTEPGYMHCRACQIPGGIPPQGTPKHAGTEAVARYAANPWGLYDMLGNVWEWTSDCWTPNHAVAVAGGPCQQRTVKGGSWYFIGPVAGAPARSGYPAALGSYDTGFRVVRDLNPVEAERVN